MEEKRDELSDFRAIKKVHEANNHISADQMINAYRKVGWMSPKISEQIKRVVKDCRICSKFAKSVSRPKVTLPKSCLFNEVVTMDLKSFG